MKLSDANDFAGYLQEMAVEIREAGLESTGIADDYVKAASIIKNLTDAWISTNAMVVFDIDKAMTRLNQRISDGFQLEK